MRGFKVIAVLVGLMALLRLAPIYYGSWQFGDFVQQHTKRIHSKEEFKQALLDQARIYSLPIEESDIVLSTKSSVLRVTVDYKVPVNLIVYQPQLKFHVIGGGLLY